MANQKKEALCRKNRRLNFTAAEKVNDKTSELLAMENRYEHYSKMETFSDDGRSSFGIDEIPSLRFFIFYKGVKKWCL